MASFDENGKYIKTNWKAGDKITATKLNKIEESIEAVNDNDISRHVEADARLDALESKDAAHDEELTNIKNTIADNKAAAELGDYDINSRMTFLEEELNEGIAEVNNVASTVDGKIATAQANMTAQVNQGKADMEAMVAEVENEMIELQNDVLEIQNDMESPQIQTFAVTDAYKFTVDHDGMMSSLLVLDNIEGLSSKDVNNAQENLLVSRYLKNICTVDSSKNYFEDAIFSKSIYNGNYTQNGTSINVTGSDELNFWSCVDFELPTLVEGKKYCILCDNVVVNSGGSAIELRYYTTDFDYSYPTNDNLEMCVHSKRLDVSGFNMIFTRTNLLPYLRMHCSLDNPSGDVTYENIQIYEVKEMIVPDIQLNSIPNGVKDEIKDGVLIKRTGYIPLNELQWHASATNVDYPDSPFNVYYASLDDLKILESTYDERKIILCNMFENLPHENTSFANDTGSSAITGHFEKGEVRIKVYKTDAPDVNSLYTWLTNHNVDIIYELQNYEYIDVNLTIKADKGDTVVMNTPKTMDFTYDIQLNTRAQIDALQESVKRNDIIASDLNDLIKSVGWEFVVRDVTEGSTTYKVFHYVLPGGLIIQGGRAIQQAGNDSVRIEYTIPFTIECITTLALGQWSNSSNHYWVVGTTDRKTFCQFVKNGNINQSDEVYWLSIGY